MNLAQEAQRRIGTGQWRGDEFQQRLGIVGSDVGMGQRRAQGGRMRGLGNVAVRGHPQRFLFQTKQAALKQDMGIGGEQSGQTLVENWVQGTRLTGWRRSAGILR